MRKLLIGTALAAVPAFGMLTAPAHAGPVPTNCSVHDMSLEFIGTHVVAENYRFCDDGTEIPLNTGVEQKNPATGAWVRVASGLGAAGYKCAGSSPSKRYRVAGTTAAGTLYPCA